jgi:hypothetical protein
VSGASGFDLQQQLPQLQPALKLWDQLCASMSPTLRQLLAAASTSSALTKSLSSKAAATAAASAAAAAAGAAADASPVGAFVALEFEFGVSLLRKVAQTLSNIQAALTGEAHLLTAAVQVCTCQAVLSTVLGGYCHLLPCITFACLKS